MQCPRCQTENREGRRFCGECGLSFASPCSACGFVNEGSEKFRWGGLLVLADTDAIAREWAQDMLSFWDSWSKPFGQDYPYLLIGDPDSVSRKIEAATREIPINECFLLIPQGIHDRDRILKSLELFASRSRRAQGGIR